MATKRVWRRLTGLGLAAGVLGVLAFAGCGGRETGAVEVMVFKGGYGSDFYEQAAEEFGAARGVEVEVIGDPRIDTQVQPLFQRGTPPDLTYPGWRFDHWKAVSDGEIMVLDEALSGPPYGATAGTWRETFEPSLLRLGQMDGKQYVMPYFYSVLGWWYDPDLFAEKGWTVPSTFNELLILCQKIKASGIAPITYQGQYPDYMIFGFLQPWIVSAGGMEALIACQDLEPGAWKSPAVVRAAEMIRELRDMGYFQQGATAMSHTESQAEFVNRRAAMIPCGTWLYSEMSGSMPAGRRMAFMPVPVLGDGLGASTRMIQIKIEPWMVPARADRPQEAIEFFKYLTSLEKAKQFVKEKGTLMSVKGANDQELPEFLMGAAQAFEASDEVWATQWKEWYPGFYTAVGNALVELMSGGLTPQQFAEKCEAEAEKLRNNPDIPKRKTS